MAKHALVTGASGFVGANLTRRLLASGHEVDVLLRPEHQVWRLSGVLSEVRVHEVDLGDAESVAATLAWLRPDWIFHLAAHGAYSSQTDVRKMVDTNIASTINLVQACLKVGFEAFVNTGSSSEYGFVDHAPSEGERLEPNSDYAVTKAASTLFCRSTARRHLASITTLRLYSVYGPFEEPSRLIPSLLVRGLDGGWPPLVNQEIVRDFVYADDVSEAYLLAAMQAPEPGAIYNIGTGRQTSIRELVDAVRSLLDIRAEPLWASMPPRSWDTTCWVSDNRRAIADLGWRPVRTLDTGLATTLAWLRQNPELLQRYRKQMQAA